MPHSWVGYYRAAFEAVRNAFELDLTNEDIDKSCDVLTKYNARVHYREVEYTPQYIFEQVTAHWTKRPALVQILEAFFDGFRLRAVICDETIPLLRSFDKTKVRTAALTDLPTAMPDEYFKRDINQFIGELDHYVSSLSCGFRKPNAAGLLQIAAHFQTTPDRTIFVGDEEKDITTAQNAGAKSVLICRDKPDSHDFGQTYTIRSLSELKHIIEKENGE